MRRAYAIPAMLTVALFAVALAVAGLAVGVVQVSWLPEWAPFAVAIVTALAALGIGLGQMLQQDEDPPMRLMPGTSSRRMRRLGVSGRRVDRGRTATPAAIGLLVGSLLMGGLVAVLRSGAEVAGGRRTTVVVERTWGVGDLLLIGGLTVASGVLALVAALLWRASREMAAAGAAAVSILALSGASMSAVGHFSFDPHLDITSTVKVDPTSGPHLTVNLRVTVRPPRLTVQLPEHRSLTLLSLGGLRISLASHRPRAPCGCGRVLPITP